MKNIGIIGNGFVGEAIRDGLKDHFNLFVYDNNPLRSIFTLKEVDEKSDVIFICVPTPMSEKGHMDSSIIESVLSKLSTDKILIIKSTVTPKTAEKILKKFNHNFVFNPEFLTERTAKEDFKNPSRIVLGGDLEDVRVVRDLYKRVFPDTKYIETDHKTACFIKYVSNCFSAVKISIMNEFKQIADSDGIIWDDALNGMLSSGWVNPMHTLVPGPDGNVGFGGKCFPKDINAFINYAIEVNVDPKIMKSSWEKNLEVREDRNWLKIPGAVSKNKK